jgi:hypothetical protein
MSVQIGNLTFDRVDYDAGAGVLYLHRADPAEAVDFDASPEGHALRFNASGELIGVTIDPPCWLLEHEGEIKITIPEQIHLQPDARQAARQDVGLTSPLSPPGDQGTQGAKDRPISRANATQRAIGRSAAAVRRVPRRG